MCFPLRLIVKQFQLCQHPNDANLFAWRRNRVADLESEQQRGANLCSELCGRSPLNQNSSCTPRNQMLIKMLKGAALQVLIFRHLQATQMPTAMPQCALWHVALPPTLMSCQSVRWAVILWKVSLWDIWPDDETSLSSKLSLRILNLSNYSGGTDNDEVG